MFEGSRNAPQGHQGLLERAGARDINAFTNLDTTAYYELIPAAQLPLALWLESDRMASMPERLDPTKLNTERMIVKNERLERHQGTAEGWVRSLASQSLYPVGHPYHHTVIGENATLDAITPDDIRAFFATHYAPGNATLSLAGSFEIAEAKALIERYFGSIPARPPPPPQAPPAIAPAPERRLMIENGAGLRQLRVGFRIPPIFSPEEPALAIAANRLQRNLRRRWKSLSGVSNANVSLVRQQLSGEFWVTVSISPKAQPELLLNTLDEELDALRLRTLDPDEIATLGGLSYVGVFLQVQSMNDRADRFASYAQFASDPGFLQKDAERSGRVTPGEVQQVAAKYLLTKDRVVARVVPVDGAPPGGQLSPPPPAVIAPPSAASAPQMPPWPDDPSRQHPPPPLARAPFEVPVPEEVRLSSGVRVMMLPRAGASTVGIRVQVARGTFDAAPGVGVLAARMLTDNSTARRTASQMREAQNELGVDPNWVALQDNIEVSAEALSIRSIRTLELLLDGLLHPAIKQEEFEEERQAQIRRLRGRASDRKSSLDAWISLALNPREHAHPGGTNSIEEILRKVERADVERFLGEAIRPENLTVILTGGFEREPMKKALEVLFKSLPPAGGVTPRGQLAAPGSQERKILLLNVPGAEQSRVVFAAPLPPLPEAERAAQRVLGELFGSSSGGRLNTVLRGKYGLTYGFSAFFREGLRQDALQGEGSVERARTAEAVQALVEEATRLTRGEIDEGELAAARDRWINRQESLFESPEETAQVLASMLRAGGDAGELKRRVAQVRQVDKAAVSRLAPGRLVPERLQILIAGDAAVIEAPLRALNLGPVELLKASSKSEPALRPKDQDSPREGKP